MRRAEDYLRRRHILATSFPFHHEHNRRIRAREDSSCEAEDEALGSSCTAASGATAAHHKSDSDQ